MLIALILILFGVLVVSFAMGGDPIPWTNRLRRANAGVSDQAEWIAPDDVISKVQGDYLQAVEWLQCAAQGNQVDRATHFLTGRFLTRFQLIANTGTGPHRIYLSGVMTACHHIEIRHFSETGSSCIVVDSQTLRKMKSFQPSRPDWVLMQQLQDGTTVLRMCYDPVVKRWKIESIIQELSVSWNRMAENESDWFGAELPTNISRDN